MLSKKECEQALENLKEWVCADNVDDMVLFRRLINEHFKFVENQKIDMSRRVKSDENKSSSYTN